MKISLIPALELLVAFLCCVWGVEQGRGSPRNIRIGGLFEDDYLDQAKAFKYAIEKVNGRRDLLGNHRLIYDVENVPEEDSFTTSKRICRQLNDGVAGIFGPMSSVPAAHVQSICHQMEMPHIETRWDYKDDRGFFYSHSVNLFPHHKPLSKAFMDLVESLHWTEFTILYEDSTALIKLQELLRAPVDGKYKITVRHLDKSDGTYRPILKDLYKRGVSRMIIDCDYSHVYDFLTQAMQLKMVGLYYHYHFTTLDIGLVDLDLVRYSGTNITAYRLVDPNNPMVEEVTSDWYLREHKFGMPTSGGRVKLRTEAALMYDAVHLFAKGLHQAVTPQSITTTPLSCGSTANTWQYGSTIINYIRMSKINGLTGMVQFDSAGRRTDFTLQLVEVNAKGQENIGWWTHIPGANGLNITKDFKQVKQEVADSLKNKTLRVVSILEKPYIMKKEDPLGKLRGNDQFEGYCVDLLKLIAKEQGFNFTIHLVKDGQYGAEIGKGAWSGMVGELMNKEADLAVASLTISFVREQVIDFTKPFMNLGISILFKRPEKKDPSLFSFLSPLSFEIWIYMLAAYTAVSFALFILGRFSPYEWYNPHPCVEETDIVENQFTLMNSLWFTIGSLMQQGSEVAPKALSTRIVSGIWWFFTLILISSYTANLAAFLTVERMTSPIENADDLSKQTKIKYGTIAGGSTLTFFKHSTIQVYERMWNFMSSTTNPSAFVNSTEEGVQRVKNGDYAYLLESTMNEYITQRNCDLMQVGGLLDSKGYGIGTPRASPYRDLLSDTILKLQEEQQLQMLYNRWWREKGVKGKCDSDEGKKDANALAIANVGGVFVVLVAGLILSLIVAVLEFIWNAHKNADEDEKAMGKKRSLCWEMAAELRFALRCFGSSHKPVKKYNKSDKYSADNGVPLVPLTSGFLTPNHKEMYA